jgi:hypothetical protein
MWAGLESRDDVARTRHSHIISRKSMDFLQSIFGASPPSLALFCCLSVPLHRRVGLSIFLRTQYTHGFTAIFREQVETKHCKTLFFCFSQSNWAPRAGPKQKGEPKKNRCDAFVLQETTRVTRSPLNTSHATHRIPKKSPPERVCAVAGEVVEEQCKRHERHRVHRRLPRARSRRACAQRSLCARGSRGGRGLWLARPEAGPKGTCGKGPDRQSDEEPAEGLEARAPEDIDEPDRDGGRVQHPSLPRAPPL